MFKVEKTMIQLMIEIRFSSVVEQSQISMNQHNFVFVAGFYHCLVVGRTGGTRNIFNTTLQSNDTLKHLAKLK